MEYLKSERKNIIYSILLGLTGGLVGVALFGLSGYMISLSFFEPPFFVIILIIAVIKLFGMMKGAFRYIERLLSHDATFRMIGRLRLNYFEKTMNAGEDTHSVKFIQKLNQHFDQVENYYIRIIYPFIVASLLSLVLMLLSFYLGYGIVLIAIVTAFLLLIVIPKTAERFTYREDRIREQTDTVFYMKLYHYIHDYVDLFVTQQAAPQKEKLSTFLNDIRRSEDKNAVYDSLMTWSAQLIQLAGIVLVIMLMYEETPLLVPMVMLLLLSYFDLVMPVMEPASKYRSVKEAVTVLDTAPAEETVTEPEGASVEKVAADHLDFRYPGSNTDVLRDISATFEAGRRHAVIGSSGSGKTTLLERIIEGHENIAVHGRDGSVSHRSLLSKASVMPQHLDFYNASIMDNITLFGHMDVPEVWAGDKLKEMEITGYAPETMITHTGRLSGGEQKRLHFIRMMAEDKDWWIMDEPTARLDDALKQKIWDEIFEKTTVIISTHDLSRLHEFDQIHYMEQGRIIESGSYRTLMESEGHVYQAVRRYNDYL